MPFKAQSNCYRTIEGVRWPNFCDVLGPEDERAVQEAKGQGARFRFVKHPQGFRIAFIHPDDYARICGVGPGEPDAGNGGAHKP